jgi:hypothetical protein
VALHGYTLGEEHGEALRRHGVDVFRRLEPVVFLNLRRAAGQARDASSASQGEGLNPALQAPETPVYSGGTEAKR